MVSIRKTKNFQKIFLFIFLALIVVSPLVTFAAPPIGGATATCTVDGLGGLMCKLNQLLNSLLPLLMTLGIVYFIWGVVRFVIGDSEEAKKKGRDQIIYGIIGLAVIVGVWGLVNIVVRTFGLEGAVAPDVTGLVAIPTSGSCPDLSSGSTNFKKLIDYFTCIIDQSIIPFIFAVAMVMFVWGAVKFFILGADEEAKREQGKQFMIWGIIALTVMISVWGLVKIVASTFGVDSSVLPHVGPKP